MTVATIQQGMTVLQQKICVARVIETGVMPIAGVVATLTLLTAAAIMRVVFTMTTEASGLGVQEGTVRVTIEACSLLMLAQ